MRSIPEFGVGQPVRELGVVGQEQESARREIEAANRHHAGGRGRSAGRRPSCGLAGSDAWSRAARLVQDDGQRLAGRFRRRRLRSEPLRQTRAGVVTNRPSTETRPSRISSRACKRLARPSFDSARSSETWAGFVWIAAAPARDGP